MRVAMAYVLLGLSAAGAAAQDAAGWAVGVGDGGDGKITVMTATVGQVPASGITTATFLGVATSAAPEALAEQLKLPRGTGLLVDFVDAGGPAAAAGVRKNDVLVRLDEQLLVSPEQLAVLVRMRKPKDKAALTLLREANQQKVTVEFGETLQARNDPNLLPPPVPGAPAAAQAAGHAAMAQQLANIVRMGGARRAASGSSTYSDGEHTLTLMTTDGDKRLLARDRTGQVLFQGPVNTEEQRKAVPADIRRKLEAMDRSLGVEVQGDADGAAHAIAIMQGGVGGIGMNIMPGIPPAFMPGIRNWGQPTGQSQTWADDEHCLTVTTRDGGKYLAVDNKNGKVLWEGYIQTDEQRKTVPEEFRPKLQKMEEKAREESRAAATFVDDGIELALKVEDGKQHLTARDAAGGKVLFEGPVDTADQRAAMPERVRSRLEKLWKFCAKVWQAQ
ncbi:MAG: PDZ domain-containing protein [Planctomycetes bacterium]|nr:PDZ domain-containing protein [Planctomycetota bacterium]